MLNQRAIGAVTLAAFLLGGWLANVVHGPVCFAHSHGISHSHDSASDHGAASRAAIVGHSHCSHGHHHHHPSDDQAGEQPTKPHNHESDCPICDHLTMSAITVAIVELPAIDDAVRLQPDGRSFEVPRGLIGLSLSRGPPAV